MFKKTLLALFLMGTLFIPEGPVEAGSARLVWRANTEPDLAGYRIYYRTAGNEGVYLQPRGSGIDVGKTETSSAPSYVLDGLADGETYYFAVTAYNDMGLESGYSLESGKTIPAAGPDNDTDSTRYDKYPGWRKWQDAIKKYLRYKYYRSLSSN